LTEADEDYDYDYDDQDEGGEDFNLQLSASNGFRYK